MTELAGAVRFAQLAAAVLVVGSFAFLALIARPALKGASADCGAFESFSLDGHRRIARWSLTVVIVSALGALWMQTLVVSDPGVREQALGGGDPGLQAVMALLTQTLYGNVWLARMILAVLLAVLLLPAETRHGYPHARFTIGFGLSACLLASIALSGHAAVGEGAEFFLQILADALHLLAVGVWLGALIPLFLLLRYCIRMSGAAGHAVVREVTWRFSRLGMACVATLMVTGGVNAWMQVGGMPQLVGTPYGQLLLLKILLLLPMLGVAAINLFRVNPAITSVSPARPDELPRHAATLARNAIIEACLGFMILLVVGILGTTPPARHGQPDWPFAFRWDWGILDTAPMARAAVEFGLVWGLLGVFVLQFAILARRRRVWTMTVGIALVIYAGSIVLNSVTTDAYPTTYRRSAVAYQAISVAGGKQLYEKHCVICHGAGGRGDGPAAEGMRPPPADLTGRHANAHTAGDLFWWLSHGIRNSAMPGFSASLAEEERWDLINFVRALAGGRRARSLAPLIEDQPWLVAPDFGYVTSSGHAKALKDHRGARLVLLVLLEPKNAAERLAQLDSAAAHLNAAGVEIIAVARDPRGERGVARARLPLVIEGNREIHETYELFAGSFSEETPGAVHVEYLIDRQGYIRARWLPAEGGAWRDPVAIANQAALLLKEVPRAPAPEDHVH